MRMARQARGGSSGRGLRWRRGRLIVVGVVLVVTIAVLVGMAMLRSRGSDSSGQPVYAGLAAGAESGPSTPVPGSAATGPVLSLSPTGVESSWVRAENALPGSPDWRITGQPSGGRIEGWADHVAAQAGDTVRLFVSTSASSFQVTAYRLGYYGGAGARRVWTSDQVAGRPQPPCPVAAGTNMVSCDGWAPSLSMPVTPAFVQGDYVLKLVGAGGEQSYIILTVWDPASTGTYLFETHSLTAQGWNTYGGFDFYAGSGPCPPGVPKYPQCNRARVVSFDRPYADGQGTGDFLDNEYPLLAFVEEHGLDVSYVSDVTLDAHPQFIAQHKAFLSLGHDETWTYAERKGLDEAVAHGVNVAFLSAAAMVRHARLQDSPIGPNRQEVNYRDAAADPLNGKGDPHQVTGNTWDSPPAPWPTLPLIGQAYMGYLNLDAPAADFVVYDGSAWVFTGTGLRTGSVLPGIIGSDFDHLSTPTPPNLQVLGHSPVSMAHGFTGGRTWNGCSYSDMTYYTRPDSKAGVFDSGMVSWINHLSPCPSGTSCPATQVRQMTGNVLWLFGQGPAGHVQPSMANYQNLQPTGS